MIRRLPEPGILQAVLLPALGPILTFLRYATVRPANRLRSARRRGCDDQFQCPGVQVQLRPPLLVQPP